MAQANDGLRPVHHAMADARPEKLRMRELWIDKAISCADHNGSSPLYFTLSGAEGHEFRMLGERGLIQFTETGALDAACAHKVVAIENDAWAHAQLLNKFPGLKIKRNTVQGLVHGNGLVRYPQGDDERICRARIINLDLDESWMPAFHEGEWIVPVSRWVYKFAAVHARPQRLAWTLYLTLHGECPWGAELRPIISAEIIEILASDPSIRLTVQNWLGAELLNDIVSGNAVDYSTLSVAAQQRLLMWLVPSFIARSCRQQGWGITICENLHYGKSPEHAPMVSWIIDFDVPGHGALHYEEELRTCLRTVLHRAARIDETGQLHYYPQL